MMRRLLLLACGLAGATAGEVIDRIVAVAGTQVVTESDMLRQMRIQALLAGKKTDFSAEAKRAAVDRMIRQVLVRNELELGRYPLPPMDEINRTLEGFKKAEFPDEAAWRRALASHEVTEDDVRDAIRLQLMLARFISYRFSPSIYVSLTDVEEYFRAHAAELAGQPLDEVRDTIERVLREERVNQALDRWLDEVRENTTVEIREDALQ